MFRPDPTPTFLQKPDPETDLQPCDSSIIKMNINTLFHFEAVMHTFDIYKIYTILWYAPRENFDNREGQAGITLVNKYPLIRLQKALDVASNFKGLRCLQVIF